MKQYKGITKARKKNGSLYYRSSITIQSKHISLGSYDDAECASKAYQEACEILRENKYTIEDYSSDFSLDFSKFVILLNYRNTGLYLQTPIYLQTNYFYYYFSPGKYLIFDREDLFFYANHKIQMRGGYYFINHYGSQYSILSRYGIKNYAKKGIDYLFVNQNEYDFRYENLKVINEYMGVSEITQEQKTIYECKIHIKGNVIVGRYNDKMTAAVAYNKAVDTLHANGFRKQYIKNYISNLSPEQYHSIYENIIISNRIHTMKVPSAST